MSIFLLEYEPATGQLLRLDVFKGEERARAQAERLRREKENIAAHMDREVVLLDAVSEAALRNTHSRYFKTVEEMARMATTPKGRSD